MKLYKVTINDYNEKAHYLFVENIEDVEKCFFDRDIKNIEPILLANTEYLLKKYDSANKQVDNLPSTGAGVCTGGAPGTGVGVTLWGGEGVKICL